MIEVIRYVLLCVLFYDIIRFRKFALICLSISFAGSFFGLVNIKDLGISGVMNNYNVSLLLLIVHFAVKGNNKYQTVNFKKYALIFLSIWSVALIHTFFQGFDKIDSLKVAIYFLPFGFIGLWKFDKEDVSHFETLFYFVVKWVTIHLIIFILYVVFEIDILQIDINRTFLVEGISRTQDGFPVISAFTLCYAFFQFLKTKNLGWTLILSIHIFASLITLVRLYIVVSMLVLILGYFLISGNSVKSTGKIIIAAGITAFLLIFSFSGLTDSLFNRYSEVSSSYQMQNNVSFIYRYYSAEERIEETMNRSPVIGIGFVNNYNKSYDFHFKYYSDFIHGDIYLPNMISTMGLVGFFFLLFFFVKILKQLFAYRFDKICFSAYAGFLIFLLHSFGTNNMYYYSGMIALFVTIGFSAIEFKFPVLEENKL